MDVSLSCMSQTLTYPHVPHEAQMNIHQYACGLYWRFQALWSRGQGLICLPQKFSVNLPFFLKGTLNVFFLIEVIKNMKINNLTSKLEKHNIVLIGFYQVENIKSETLFNSIY